MLLPARWLAAVRLSGAPRAVVLGLLCAALKFFGGAASVPYVGSWTNGLLRYGASAALWPCSRSRSA